MNITIQLSTTTITRTIPDSWNDCSPQQAMTLLHLLQLDGPTLMAKRLSVLSHLLQLSDAELREWQLAHAAEHGKDWKEVFFGEIQSLLDGIPWLLEPTTATPPPSEGEGGGRYQLAPTLTKCPFPAINVNVAPSFRRPAAHRSPAHRLTLYCAADELANVSGEELAYLFDSYEKYAADPTAANCDRLIAILYRKSKLETPEQLEANWYGDRRQPFHEHNVEARANQIAKAVPPMAKNLILFWFLSCRMKMIADWPVVFKAADQVKREGPDFKWWGVYMAILDDPTKIDDFARKPYTDLFTTISWYDAKAKEEEMKRAMAAV